MPEDQSAMMELWRSWLKQMFEEQLAIFRKEFEAEQKKVEEWYANRSAALVSELAGIRHTLSEHVHTMAQEAGKEWCDKAELAVRKGREAINVTDRISHEFAQLREEMQRFRAEMQTVDEFNQFLCKLYQRKGKRNGRRLQAPAQS